MSKGVRMTLEEALTRLDDLYKQHGRDYVVSAENHPEIMRAFADQAIAEMEAEIEARKPA